MPVKLGVTRLEEGAEARIEIVPLIDIMFFLLASFMLVSLSMVNLKAVTVNLPTASTATPELKKEFVDISVDKGGGVFLDKKPVGSRELAGALGALVKARPGVRVFISGDEEARHGAIMAVLNAVRAAGIEKVGFEIRDGAKAGSP